MTHRFSRKAGLLLFLAGCGSGTSGGDAGPAAAVDAGGGTSANICPDNGGVAPMICTCNPALATVTDLTGTWVLQTIGAQTVQAPLYSTPFHLKSIGVSLVQVQQTGNDVVISGQYCDRIQQDDPKNPGPVIVIDAWRLTPTPVQRSGTFAPDDSGQWVLASPTVVEVAGANLANPATDPLPTDPNDPLVVDSDHDGFPGISIGLGGLIPGVLRSVQRQTSALRGVAVAADRIEGGMAYTSDQSVLASDPANLKTFYEAATAFSDPAACSSSFVMVKVPDSVDSTLVDCAWVRGQEAALLGL